MLDYTVFGMLGVPLVPAAELIASLPAWQPRRRRRFRAANAILGMAQSCFNEVIQAGSKVRRSPTQ